MRVVFDTNVFVSALLSATGTPADLLRGWRAGMFTLVVSEHLLAELEEVMLRPKFGGRFTGDQVTVFVEVLRTSADVFADPLDPARSAPDPKDDFLVALASVGRADALVTGDVRLQHTEALGLPVLSPRRFMELIERLEP